MPHREPTIRSRELGDGLRQAMEAAGLTGKRQASEVDIAAFLGMCRVKGAERDRLLGRCAGSRTPRAGSSSTAPGETSSLFLEKPEEIRAYRRILGRWRILHWARDNRGS